MVNVNGIRKIEFEAQMVTKMDNSIKKGKLIVIKIDKCRASMGLLSTAEKERRGITLIQHRHTMHSSPHL